MSDGKVNDPNEESAEFCLDCYKKHVGHTTILLTEALDRVRQDTNHQDAKVVDFIRLHANKAMDELAAAEDHVNHVTNANAKTKAALDKLANETRVMRDQIRTYLKTAPNPKAENWETKKQEVIAGTNLPRVDLLQKSLAQATKSREQADILSSEVGCGACMATPEEMAKLKAELNKIVEKHKDKKEKPAEKTESEVSVPQIISEPKTEAKQEDFLTTLMENDPLMAITKNVINLFDELFQTEKKTCTKYDELFKE